MLRPRSDLFWKGPVSYRPTYQSGAPASCFLHMSGSDGCARAYTHTHTPTHTHTHTHRGTERRARKQQRKQRSKKISNKKIRNKKTATHTQTHTHTHTHTHTEATPPLPLPFPRTFRHKHLIWNGKSPRTEICALTLAHYIINGAANMRQNSYI